MEVSGLAFGERSDQTGASAYGLSRSDLAIVAVALLLPIPLLAVSGLNIPLPGIVERGLAAVLPGSVEDDRGDPITAGSGARSPSSARSSDGAVVRREVPPSALNRPAIATREPRSSGASVVPRPAPGDDDGGSPPPAGGGGGGGTAGGSSGGSNAAGPAAASDVGVTVGTDGGSVGVTVGDDEAGVDVTVDVGDSGVDVGAGASTPVGPTPDVETTVPVNTDSSLPGLG